MEMNHPWAIGLGVAGLSTAQLWVAIILAQVAGLLWWSRRLVAYAGADPGIGAGLVESKVSDREWELRVATDRVQQLKAASYEQLSRMPLESTERVTSHDGRRLSLRISRETLSDGALLLRVTPLGRDEAGKPAVASHTLVVRPDAFVDAATR